MLFTIYAVHRICCSQYMLFIMPQLLYCLPVWGNCNEIVAHMLNNCLQKVLSIITGDSTAGLSKAFYQAHGLLPYHSLLLLSNIRLVLRPLHSDSLLMKTNKFALSLLSRCNTYGSVSLKLKLVKVKKSTNKLCFSVDAAIHWNDLLFNFSSIVSFNRFYSAVNNFILSALP